MKNSIEVTDKAKSQLKNMLLNDMKLPVSRKSAHILAEIISAQIASTIYEKGLPGNVSFIVVANKFKKEIKKNV